MPRTEWVVKCKQCGIIERGSREECNRTLEGHDQFHSTNLLRPATDGGRAHAGATSTPPAGYTPDTVRQLAGVGDQDPTCEHGTVGCPGPAGGLDQCFDCFLAGGDADE